MVTVPTPSAAASPVFLRFPRGSDEREYVALREAHKSFLEPWEPLPAPTDDPSQSARFERILDTCNSDRAKRFLICLTASGQIIGQCSLGEIIRGPLQQAFMGYWLIPTHTNRGYMTAALRLLIAFAFDTLALHRVEANIQPHNDPSLAVARRLGLRKEGFSPRYLQINGTWADHERWAITREDFTAQRAAEPNLWTGPTNAIMYR